jgi:hypothetical protein
MTTTTAGKPLRIPVFHKLFLLYISCFIFTGDSKAQCSASSAISAGSSINDASYGNLSFSNPGNASGSDNSRASANVLATLLTGTTNYLKATGFNFSIPPGASICGIRVEIEKRAGGLSLAAWIRDDRVQLIKGGVITGNNQAIASDWSGTEAYHTYGGITDLWGTTLDPADVNASDFGVAISAEFLGLLFVLPSVQIDDIRMTVYFNIVLPVQIISFDATLKNNSASLQWEISHTENNGSMTLQRQAPGASEWTSIEQFSMDHENLYRYTDPLDKKGNYLYRLAINTGTGQPVYSKIQSVSFEGRTGISVYPNPSHDFIIINGTAGVETISVINAAGHIFRLQVKALSSSKSQANIQTLLPGIYFILANGERACFLKR